METPSILIRFVLVTGLALLASAAQAQAQTQAAAQSWRDPPKEWDVTVGAGAGLRPTFEGSDRYIVRPLPLIALRWRNTISLGEGGLSLTMHVKRFRFGGGLTFSGGRDDKGRGSIFGSGDDRLSGLGKINSSLGVHGFVSTRVSLFNLDVSAVKYTASQNHGLEVNLGASMPLPLSKKWLLMPHIRATWADGNYMQTFFGVTPVQSAASIFTPFSANGGFKDVQGGVNLIYRINRHWYVGGDVGVTRLLGDAAASPISISDTSLTVITMAGYRF